MKKVQVHPYNPDWPRQFQELHQRLWPAVSHLATSIEHVGSTAVPGLPAKPIIDLDIVIPTRELLPAITAALATLGYQHRGNQGIPDRDAYRLDEPIRTHHLYVCPADSLPLHNHLVLRDHLRASVAARDAYAQLKQDLATQFPTDIDSYIAGKTSFILDILASQGQAQSNTSPSMEHLFAQALDKSNDPEASWDAISQLHARAGQEVFDKAASCCASSDPWIRARGADILAQLRISREQPTHPFERQAFDVITALLIAEQDEEPISAAITALGHIRIPEGIDHCIRFIQHPSAQIRFSVAFALGSLANHTAAVEALFQLMTDEDASVRDWATFGLGVLGELDSPKIREALFLRTTDPDPDTREEAICGLAKRHDPRVIPMLQQLLGQPEVSCRIDEAAGFFPDLQSSKPNEPA